MSIYLGLAIVILTSLGQLILKLGANRGGHLLFNRYVVLGYGIFLIVVPLSIFLMNYLPLKYISIVVSFCYPTTVFVSWLFLKEKISQNTIFACLMIVMGCIIFNL